MRRNARNNDARELELYRRAVRAKCLDCSGGMRGLVKSCRIKDCPLWELRCEGAGAEAAAAQERERAAGGLPGQMDLTELIGEG